MTSVGRKPTYKLEMPSFRKMDTRVAMIELPPDFGVAPPDMVVVVIIVVDDDDLRGIMVDSMGKTQSMSPLFKRMVPHPGQVVLGPIFTPRNNNDDDE